MSERRCERCGAAMREITAGTSEASRRWLCHGCDTVFGLTYFAPGRDDGTWRLMEQTARLTVKAEVGCGCSKGAKCAYCLGLTR